MITTVYLVRHARSDNSVAEEALRPLTEKGMEDRRLVTDILKGKEIKAVYSSPYLRAVQTVSPLADALGLEVISESAFRERAQGEKAGIADFALKQWHDRDFSAPMGESLNETVDRFLARLYELIKEHEGQAFVVGSHGMAISAVASRLFSGFDYDEYLKFQNVMPFIAKAEFEADGLVSLKVINPFEKQ